MARQADNAAVHGARAKSNVRRYCRANRCRFLWTLTFAHPCRDFTAAGDALSAFLRQLRERKGNLPIVAVPEPHPGGHGWHWHFATDRFLSIELIRRLWGEGHVFVGDPRNVPARVSSRKLASYLAKYLGKELDTDAGDGDQADAGALVGRQRGQHRYRLARGFAPGTLVLHFQRKEDAYTYLHARYGQHDQHAAFSVGRSGAWDSYWFSFPDRFLYPPPIVARLD